MILFQMKNDKNHTAKKKQLPKWQKKIIARISNFQQCRFYSFEFAIISGILYLNSIIVLIRGRNSTPTKEENSGKQLGQQWEN